MKSIMTLLPNIRQALQKRSLQIGIAVGLFAVSALVYQFVWQGPEVVVAEVVQKDFVQTVVASGHVENPHRIDLGAQVTGTVAHVPVQEGQSVKAGQVLIQLESSEMLAALQQAKAALQQAEAKLRQLREVQVPVATHALTQALVNHATSKNALLRAQELFSKGFVGQAALDEAKRAELVSQSQVLSLQEQLASLKPSGSDFFAAQANLAQAQAGAALATSRLRYARIIAPVEGTLILRNVESGDVVQPGKVLMVLSPIGATQLVVQIDEKHLRQLKLGQSARASADAFSAEQFSASLSFINPGVDAQRGSVTIKLTVQDPPTYLQQDMTVSLNIEVANRPHAVLVSTEAIHDIDKAPWVQKVVKGRVVNQAIQLGLRGTTHCEVLAGLSPGDLTLRDGPLVKENSRIRVKRLADKS